MYMTYYVETLWTHQLNLYHKYKHSVQEFLLPSLTVILLGVSTFNARFTLLAKFWLYYTVQMEYRYYAMQQISRTYPFYITEILHPLSLVSPNPCTTPAPIFTVLDNHYFNLCFYNFDCFRFLI